MTENVIEIGVIVAKRKLRGAWLSHAWLPTSVLPAAPDAAPWTRLSATVDEDVFYAGSAEVRLYPSETSHYRDNLASGHPSIWVALRHGGGDEYAIGTVTADPYEGESLVAGIGEVVEALPMPFEVQATVAAFVEAFHVERVFFKRKRDRANPEAMARGGSGPKLGSQDE